MSLSVVAVLVGDNDGEGYALNAQVSIRRLLTRLTTLTIERRHVWNDEDG